MFKVFNYQGNTGAYSKWLSEFSDVELITELPVQLDQSDVYCIPGGNNFGHITNARQNIEILLSAGVKTLLVCGAFQILFSRSEETPGKDGLDFFGGNVQDLKRLNVGTNNISLGGHNCEVYFNNRFGIKAEDTMIDKNSYEVFLDQNNLVVGIKNDKLLALQFHPELSKGNFNREFKLWLDAK